MMNMTMSLFGQAVFPSHFEIQRNEIINAFMGNNDDFPVHELYLRGEKVCLRDGEFKAGKGVYILYRENPFNPMVDFYYVGSTIERGHKARCTKVLRHGRGKQYEGDCVLPVSKFIRDNCHGDMTGIKTCFVPLDMSDEDIRELESAIIRELKVKYTHKIKNVITTSTSTRPEKKEEMPSLIEYMQ